MRGRGLFLGIEFVADPETKQPFPDAAEFGKRVMERALEYGLVVLAAKGTVDRLRGDHLLLAPPLILTRAQADQIAEGLCQAIVDVQGSSNRPH
ncbi:MAG: hypothetical protein AAGA56_00805 [Myxococcota bacterium]